MAVNKVQLANGTTLIDLTDSTFDDASQLQAGITAYDRSGTLITGTASGGGGGITGTAAWVWEDTGGVLHFTTTYPGDEPTMVSETLVFIPDAAVVGTAIVGESRTG